LGNNLKVGARRPFRRAFWGVKRKRRRGGDFTHIYGVIERKVGPSLDEALTGERDGGK